MHFNLNCVKSQRVFSLDPVDREEKIEEISKIREPKRQYDPPIELAECSICFEESEFWLGTTFCDHVYCYECTESHVISQIDRLGLNLWKHLPKTRA